MGARMATVNRPLAKDLSAIDRCVIGRSFMRWEAGRRLSLHVRREQRHSTCCCTNCAIEGFYMPSRMTRSGQ
jgi:hypothetical protein